MRIFGLRFHKLMQACKPSGAVYEPSYYQIVNYVIKDIVEISNLSENSYIYIGSQEFGNQDEDNFVISLEINKSLTDKSDKIYKAWISNSKREKLKKVNSTNIRRVYEGFYKKIKKLFTLCSKSIN